MVDTGQWGGLVETDSGLKQAAMEVAFILVRRAVAQGGVPPVGVELGVAVERDF